MSAVGVDRDNWEYLCDQIDADRRLEGAAKALGELTEDVVFLGAATLPLLIRIPAISSDEQVARGPRPQYETSRGRSSTPPPSPSIASTSSSLSPCSMRLGGTIAENSTP